MRVAQIVASYHPVHGGVETHVRRIAEGLALAGDEVTVLTHQTGGLPAEEAVRRALTLDDSIGEAHDTLGVLSWRYNWDGDGTERELHDPSKVLSVGHGDSIRHGRHYRQFF